MLQLIPRRTANLGAFVVVAAMLAYAYYAQFVLLLEPCPLCIFQRVAFIALALIFLAAGLHAVGRIGSRVYALLAGMAALCGAAIAGWHVRLQHLPADQVPECGPGLDYMLEILPITEVLERAFTGSGECAEINWSLLGLSMPGWALIWFVLLGVFGVYMNWRHETDYATR